MDALESKMLAEALNKVDKLVEIVQVMQSEINILDENFDELVKTAQRADQILADQISELHESMVTISDLLMIAVRAPGQ